MTIFDDLFVETPDGHIHWLDTGSDFLQDTAPDRESWLRSICDRPALFFRSPTLLQYRAMDYRPKSGEAYSWIKPPLLGGEESVDNFGFVSASVHVSHLGRLAQALQGGSPPPEEEDEDPDALYTVVINEEKQYSMWPAGEEIPAGWKDADKTGKKQECLEFIAEVWTDPRPESLRQKREAESKASADLS